MTIVNDGMRAVAALIGTDTSASTTAFGYIAIGTDATPPTAADTGLAAQDQIAAATGTNVTVNVSYDTLQLVKDAFSFGSSKSIKEVGVFNGSTGSGTDAMLSRATFAAVNVTSDDTLKVTVKETVVQG